MEVEIYNIIHNTDLSDEELETLQELIKEFFEDEEEELEV